MRASLAQKTEIVGYPLGPAALEGGETSSENEAQMATLFLYGPYASVSEFGLPPGAQETWVIGPWPWYANAIAATAHPLALAGADRTMTVTSVTSQAAPNGDRLIVCTVQNVGVDSANYALWVGGAAP